MFKQFQHRKPALFFDYDGTLTPIVSHPENAVLAENMRKKILAVAKHYPVAVVSGRDLRDIQQLVQLGDLIYAGSHGYHIKGPNDLFLENEQAQAFLPLLDELELQLRKELGEIIAGAKIDRKKYAIAVHYRNVDEAMVDVIKSHAFNILHQQWKAFSY